jgi:hypothetical protein
MKRIPSLTILLCAVVFASMMYASVPKNRPGAVRIRASSAARSSSSRSTGRPYYGGGKHTASHGGSYPGSVSASHKYGHYRSPVTGTRTYGKHK